MRKFRLHCVLMYHDLYTVDRYESGFKTNSGRYTLPADAFEHQVELIENYLKSNSIDSDYVQYTFDDGGISSYTVAAPILEKYNRRGIFFIPTKYIGQDGFMNEDQIRDLYHRGHIIGAHSHTHRQRMTSMSNEQLYEDWSKSIQILSGITGSNITTASLPNGYYSKSLCDTLRRLGIEIIYTSNPLMGPVDGECGRFGINCKMTNEYVLSIVYSPIVRTRIYVKKKICFILRYVLGNSYLRVRSIFIHK